MDNKQYLKLLTSEHYVRPKFHSYVKTFLEELDAINSAYNSFNTIFNLNNAVGDQLDKIGFLFNVSREVPFTLPGGETTLQDNPFRKLIRSNIYRIHWDGTRKQLEKILQTILQNSNWDLVDNQDMSVDIYIDERMVTAVDRLLFEHNMYLPKPAGVKYNLHFTSDPIFGWDMDSQYVKGWDKGKWQIE